MRDKDRYNQYMREYLQERYQRRLKQGTDELGGTCVWCKATDDLKLVMLNQNTPPLTVSVIASLSDRAFQDVLMECSLLCSRCVQKRRIHKRGQSETRNRHGTVSAYRHCRCDACRAANAAASRDYRARRRQRQPA